MGFSENLRELRQAKKMTQEELAKKLGVTRQAVISWEDPKGKRPSFEFLVGLVFTLKVTWNRLMAGEIERIKKSDIAKSGEALLKLGEVASEYHQAIDNTVRKEKEK